MSVTITPLDKGERYRVNNTVVYKDSNENWIATQELTSNEKRVFNNYIQEVINNEHYEDHPEVYYDYN
jgi:hypothetical protein